MARRQQGVDEFLRHFDNDVFDATVSRKRGDAAAVKRGDDGGATGAAPAGRKHAYTARVDHKPLAVH